MADLRLIYTNQNYDLQPTVTASSSATGYVASAVIDEDRQSVWKSQASPANPEWLKFAYASAKFAVSGSASNVLAILGHNMVTAGVDYIALEKSSVADFTSDVVTVIDSIALNTVITDDSDCFLGDWASGAGRQYWRLSPTYANTQIQIGEVAFFLNANIVDLTAQMDYPVGRGVVGVGKQIQTLGGQVFGESYSGTYKTWSYTARGISLANKDKIVALAEAQKVFLRPFLMIDHETTGLNGKAHWVILDSAEFENSQIYAGLYDCILKLREAP